MYKFSLISLHLKLLSLLALLRITGSLVVMQAKLQLRKKNAFSQLMTSPSTCVSSWKWNLSDLLHSLQLSLFLFSFPGYYPKSSASENKCKHLYYFFFLFGSLFNLTPLRPLCFHKHGVGDGGRSRHISNLQAIFFIY